MRNGIGLSNTLCRMNLSLADNLERDHSFFLLDAQRWVESAGQQAFDPRLWYMAKIPYGNLVFKEAVRELKAALRNLQGCSKKLIIIDLDDTIWGGSVGEVGWANLKLGGHDPVGEAFVDFQKVLKSFKKRGVMLGMVSKNDERAVKEAFQNHPEMVLAMEDFVGYRINWDDKAKNVQELVAELNLGIHSVLFIDDNPAERARVRDALPEVFVPEWPHNPLVYVSTLLGLDCFGAGTLTEEDLHRHRMYADESRRKDLRKSIGSLDDWLTTLDMKVVAESLSKSNIQRVAQLFNKTNQMNLSTRRMSESELMKWADEKGNTVWVFRVSDRIGSSGLTGIASLEAKGNRGKIADFILSCRVIGRKVEEAMLHIIVREARRLGLIEVYAAFIQTPRNSICLDFFMKSGFAYTPETNTFHFPLTEEYPLPVQITLDNSTLP